MSLDVAPAAASQPAKVVYNLNPFDQGAQRDLKQPKAVDGPALSAPAAADERCEAAEPESGDE